MSNAVQEAASDKPGVPLLGTVRASKTSDTMASAVSVERQATDADSKAAPGSWATLWLTDRDVLVFTVLAAILLALLAYRWAELSGWGTREIEIERLTPLEYNFQLDPNDATWVELAQLEGVGETLALRIVEDRETNGPFQTLEDLDRVKGIGAKTLDRLRPYLHISSSNSK